MGHLCVVLNGVYRHASFESYVLLKRAASTLIGASNFFELSVATVVGVLVEMPVMLPVVKIVRRSEGW